MIVIKVTYAPFSKYTDQLKIDDPFLLSIHLPWNVEDT